MLPTSNAIYRASQTAGSFYEKASTAVVAFEAVSGPDDDQENDQDRHGGPGHEKTRQKIRMGFQVCYRPPVVTFRFNINVFGYDTGGQKVKTTLYFDVPRHYISSLEHIYHVDPATAPELDQDDMQQLGGGVTRVQFRLHRPGNLITPSQEYTLKPASQHVLASMTLWATVLEFALFIPRTTLSKDQLQNLQQAVTSTTLHDQQQQDKEHDWWLAALYGGVGGRLLSPHSAIASSAINKDDVSTASESGESTIAAVTPPAYRSWAVSNDQDATAVKPNIATTSELDDGIATASPPPYDLAQPEAVIPTAAANVEGKRAGKRVCDSDDLHARFCRRRLDGSPKLADEKQSHSDHAPEASCFEKQRNTDLGLRQNFVLVLSKLDQVLEKNRDLEDENRFLKAQLSVMRENQGRMNAKLEEMMDWKHQHVKKIHDLENRSADIDTRVAELGKCHEDLEERQAELEDRQARTEEMCDNNELEITDKVHDALKNRLIDALETM